MRTTILAIIFTCASVLAFGKKYPGSSLANLDTIKFKQSKDSVVLQTEGTNAFYQKTIKLDSNITEPLIYLRAVQFMASRNITQTYGYQEEGKLIFSTFQDLNINTVSIQDDNSTVFPYSVQFAITLDLKNKRYRYTIHNVVFFLPTELATGVKHFLIFTKNMTTESRGELPGMQKPLLLLSNVT